MNYCLYKLNFRTSLHIGESSSARSLQTSEMTLAADSLFSTLCHAALSCGGESQIEKLYRHAADGELLLSDTMPYYNDTLYLPKPYCLPKKERQHSENSSIEKKKMKKLSFIPVEKIADFLASINGDDKFSVDGIENGFGVKTVLQKVGINGFEKTEPYFVGLFTFNPNAGLYFIIKYQKKEIKDFISRLLHMASLSGIGGKISSGYGKFVVEEVIDLAESSNKQTKELVDMLNSNNSAYISLTTSLPKDDELENAVNDASYSLIRRGGYVSSKEYGRKEIKKKTQYFFSIGSVFRQKFNGDIYNVGIESKHPVYRYAKPIFLGVNL